MTSLMLSALLLCSTFISVAVAGNAAADRTCESLKVAFSGWQKADVVITPDKSTFNDSISSYAFLESRLRPYCIVRPQGSDDVATAVRILGQDDSVKFAIRSGGHSINKANVSTGFSGIENGITVDLSRLGESYDYSSETNSCQLGPGGRWEDVYINLSRTGNSIQGGRASSVGVGGLITGGGIGFFSPQKGWVCDSVISFDVTLANGDHVVANNNFNTDLFTALKGGQNNFGIVTRIQMDLVDWSTGLWQGWGGLVTYPNASIDEVFETFIDFKNPEHWKNSHNSIDRSTAYVGVVYNTTLDDFAGVAGLYYHGEHPDNKPIKNFTKIEPKINDTTRFDLLAKFAMEAEDDKRGHRYTHWATTTFRTSSKALTRVYERFRYASHAIRDNYGGTVESRIVFGCVPAAANDTNPNVLGFDPSSHPEQDLINILVEVVYIDPAFTDSLEKGVQGLIQAIDAILDQEGVRDDRIYLNYAAAWQDPFKGYGQENIDFMKAVAKKYDPKGMFQKQVVGGFKLPA